MYTFETEQQFMNDLRDFMGETGSYDTAIKFNEERGEKIPKILEMINSGGFYDTEIRRITETLTKERPQTIRVLPSEFMVSGSKSHYKPKLADYKELDNEAIAPYWQYRGEFNHEIRHLIVSVRSSDNIETNYLIENSEDIPTNTINHRIGVNGLRWLFDNFRNVRSLTREDFYPIYEKPKSPALIFKVSRSKGFPNTDKLFKPYLIVVK